MCSQIEKNLAVLSRGKDPLKTPFLARFYSFTWSIAWRIRATASPRADEVYIMQLNLEVFSDDSYESYEYGVSLVYDYKLTQLDGWPHYNTKESEFSVRCLKDAE